MRKEKDRAEYSELFSDIPNLEEQKFLDVGSGGLHVMGSALTARIDYLREEQGLRELTDEERNEIARKNHISLDRDFDLGGLNFAPEISTQGDALALPFPNQSFDIVGMGSLLHWFRKKKDLKKAINEASRVLKEEGYFVAGNTSLLPKIKWDSPLFNLRADLVLWGNIPRLKRYERYLKDSGFTILDSYIDWGGNRYGGFHSYHFVAQKNGADKNSY